MKIHIIILLMLVSSCVPLQKEVTTTSNYNLPTRNIVIDANYLYLKEVLQCNMKGDYQKNNIFHNITLSYPRSKRETHFVVTDNNIMNVYTIYIPKLSFVDGVESMLSEYVNTYNGTISTNYLCVIHAEISIIENRTVDGYIFTTTTVTSYLTNRFYCDLTYVNAGKVYYECDLSLLDYEDNLQNKIIDTLID